MKSKYLGLYCLLVALTVIQPAVWATGTEDDAGDTDAVDTKSTTSQKPEVDDKRKKIPADAPEEIPSSTPSGSPDCTNSTCVGQRAEPVSSGITNYVTENKDMLMRTFYVLIGLTGIIVVYFVVRTVRSQRRKSRTKRYGLLSTRDDQLEMAPLDQDDEDDDLTVFDINNHGK